MEKNAGGKTSFRSERYYRKTVENVASDYERMMEKIVEDVERETDEEERKRKEREAQKAALASSDKPIALIKHGNPCWDNPIWAKGKSNF